MMFLLKKYINLLLWVVLCTLSTEAMAQHSQRAKQQKSTRKTELVESARKEKKSKNIDKAAKPSKAKEEKKISKEKKPKRSGVKRRAEAIKSARKDARNSKRRTVNQSEMEVIVSAVQPAATTTAHKVSAIEPTPETSQSVVIEQKTLTRAEKIKERGITNMDNIFVAKGSWIGGAGASFSNHINDNYTFAIIDGIVSEGYTVRVSAMGAYAIRNNMAIGVRGTYNRSNLTVNNANLQFGDEETGTQISVNSYKAVRHTYSAAAIWRQYIPIGKSKRFAIFNEISLGAGASQAIYAADQPIKGTYEEGYNISLGVSPGLMAFATNDIAIEVNVGVMGINYSDVKQVHNQIYTGNRRSSNMNFKVNLLSIGVGVSFYL